MNSNKFDIFFNIDSTSISIGVFNSQTDKNIFLETHSYITNINNIDPNLNHLKKILEKKNFQD